MTTTSARSHPDYIAGYEDRWFRRRPAADPSPEYRAGWDAAGEVAAMFREAGFSQDRNGDWQRLAPNTQVLDA